jgi:eukaryotic-like serine/threonine-protein kinase
MLVKQHPKRGNGTDFARVLRRKTMESNAAHSPTRRDAPAASGRAASSELRPTLGSGPRAGEHYELLGELATGGMATVYLGRLRRAMGFSRLVAIKCMHPQYAKDPSFASMFVDEARLTARLRHPNIVPTLDIVADDGQLLIVMEYVEGESLADLLRLVRAAGDRVPVAIACAVVHDVLLGLHEAHEARDDDGAALAIIHRDVSPQNVVVGLDGLSRVLDFGVARARSRVHHSSEGEIKGKIPYMPPEQLFGESIDRRVDVYAAGVLLWESLVSARLFEGSSEELLVRRIDAGDVPAPSTRAPGISPELDAVVMRALCTSPDGRFPTALAMAEALSSLVALPPRTEISAWMRRFASPRAVPGAAFGDSRELARPTADAVIAVLERDSGASERHSRPSLVPVIADGPIAGPAPTSSRLATIVGIAAFALAGVLVGRAMRAENAHAAPAHHASEVALAPLPSAVAAIEPSVASAREPAAAAVDTQASPLPVVAKAAHGKRRAVRPRPAEVVVATPAPRATTTPATTRDVTPATTRDVTPATTPATVTPATTRDVTCRLPYVVDAEGHRHYKVECL